MALYNWTGSAWTPGTPPGIVTSASVEGRTDTVYPFVKDGIDGTAVVREVTTSRTTTYVALTEAGADYILGNAASFAGGTLGADQEISVRKSEDGRVVGSYSIDVTQTLKATTLASWAEGPPAEDT